MAQKKLSVDHFVVELEAGGESNGERLSVKSDKTNDSTSATSLNANELERYYAKAGQAEWGC